MPSALERHVRARRLEPLHDTLGRVLCRGLCDPLVPIVETHDIGQKLCDVVDVRALGHLLLGGL